jgi:F-type H+-transporting ATPase subunit b
LKFTLPAMRRSSNLLRSFLLALAFSSLTIAPFRAAAQSQTAVPGAPTSASAPPSTPDAQPSASADSKAPLSQEEQEQAFLHAPIVQSLARVLHLNLQTTIYLLLGINFAIIFFGIVIPLSRVMPKLFRKRSETLSQDLKTAREATTDAQSRLSAVEAKLAGLGEEMQKFRNQVEQDSLEDEKRIKAALSEESARIVAAAEQEIGVAAAQIRRGLRDFAADLAIDQASRQLNLTPETDRALIAEFVAGVTADPSGKGGRN